jgi:hypothetical protein
MRCMLPAGGGGWSLEKALGVLAADLRALCRHPTCPLTMLAMALYNGALGGFAYFGPKAARDVFVLDPQAGDLLFGAITVATGDCRGPASCLKELVLSKPLMLLGAITLTTALHLVLRIWYLVSGLWYLGFASAGRSGAWAAGPPPADICLRLCCAPELPSRDMPLPP